MNVPGPDVTDVAFRTCVVILPPVVMAPAALILPLTSRVWTGAVVPIPTRPSFVMVSRGYMMAVASAVPDGVVAKVNPPTGVWLNDR